MASNDGQTQHTLCVHYIKRFIGYKKCDCKMPAHSRSQKSKWQKEFTHIIRLIKYTIFI